MMGCEGLISNTLRPFMYSAALASAIAYNQSTSFDKLWILDSLHLPLYAPHRKEA